MSLPILVFLNGWTHDLIYVTTRCHLDSQVIQIFGEEALSFRWVFNEIDFLGYFTFFESGEICPVANGGFVDFPVCLILCIVKILVFLH